MNAQNPYQSPLKAISKALPPKSSDERWWHSAIFIVPLVAFVHFGAWWGCLSTTAAWQWIPFQSAPPVTPIQNVAFVITLFLSFPLICVVPSVANSSWSFFVVMGANSVIWGTGAFVLGRMTMRVVRRTYGRRTNTVT